MNKRQEEINRIKENIPIWYIAEQAGLKKKSENQKCIRYYSPVSEHYELVIYKENNYFVDYGAGKKGSIIDFYMHIYNLDYVSTIKKLRKMLKNEKINNLNNLQKLNDFKLAEEEFFKILREKLPLIKKKTKFLRKIRNFFSNIQAEIEEEIQSEMEEQSQEEQKQSETYEIW